MAAVSASFITSSLATAALQPATTPKSLVARFNGLKACPRLRQRTTVSRNPAIITRLSIRASANAETLSAVQGIIAQQLATDVEKITPEAKFADLGADSLDTVEIIMALEETFKITLDEEGAQQITTVQEAADLIQGTLSKA